MSISRHHTDWLSLVPNSGPFLSLPVLAQAFPQGLDAHDAENARRLRMAFVEWDGNQSSLRPDPGIHRAWIKLVLDETLGYDELLAEGQAIPQTLRSEIAEYGETLRPDWIVNDPTSTKTRLLIQVYPRSQSLTRPVALSRWKASPDTRMMQLLHDTGIRLGIVTNGDHWMLVNAPKNETTGYASWYSNLWLEESVTLRAFRTLLGVDRLFSVPENETLEALLDKSADDQQEVTDQLGYQVRKAVEVLVQALDKADHDHGRKLLADVDERVLYESALTVMMRLVFLFCAEERELLLLGDDLYDKNYAVSTLREQLRVAADQFGEEILGLRYDAWPRLITSFRAVYAGVRHHRLNLPAYGGSLFYPDRFPFLEGRKPQTSWQTVEATPLPVSNRTVLHLLEALQVLQIRLPGGGAAEARKLSFRSLDIEQIGHVYEGLLDHTAERADQPVLGLQGTRDKEPEIPLADLESSAAKGEKELLKFLKDETGRSESALKKGLNALLGDQVVARFRTACQNPDLWKRVEPFAGLVRFDTVEYPVVITTGSVYVTAGTDRRSSGTHYTPKSLTEPIVQYTLEPLVFVGPAEGWPKEKWQLRTAKELLALKVCDMACGSGAFLVQVCRYLAARLLEAWDALQKANPGTLRITPEGQPSTGQPGELLIPDDLDERQTYALRMVAQRCIYGVDKNPLAVEMAKLSLWLLTLARDKPFTFLDHAIRAGDSLVGVSDTDQLMTFSLDRQGTATLGGIVIKKLDHVKLMRDQMTRLPENNAADVERKRLMFANIQDQTKRLTFAADLLLAASWKPGRADEREQRLKEALFEVEHQFRDQDANELEAQAAEVRRQVGVPLPFHWLLEFPEVFVDRGGFDAFVGNPPFMGGTYISGNLGSPFREFLVDNIAHGQRGNADLCAFFFLRAASLLRNGGQLGFIATNTISQGDTRDIGLDQLTKDGFVISRAVSSRRWPGTASLEISKVWLRRGQWNGPFTLDEIRVGGILSYLTETGQTQGNPFRLASNSGVSFTGNKVYGEGFVLDPESADKLISASGKNKDVIFPYLSGEDLNSHPNQMPKRWVINFGDRPLEESKLYADCIAIVETLVKPYRMTVNREHTRTKWWLHEHTRSELYRTISSYHSVLAKSRVGNMVSFALVPTNAVFADTVAIFALDLYRGLAVLQSSLHECWARQYGSSMRTDLRYTPSDCFETFPFPGGERGASTPSPMKEHSSTGREGIDAPLSPLERIGETYHNCRRQIMLARQEGLTKTYNRFHNPDESAADIQKLRDLHVEMDRAVADAYGWSDLDLGHGFHETKQGTRFTIGESARREVLARLLKLNHERHAEEERQGLLEKKKPKTPKKGKKPSKAEPTFFSEEEDE